MMATLSSEIYCHVRQALIYGFSWLSLNSLKLSHFRMVFSVATLWWRLLFTVYPKKYAHGFCFAVLCCGYTLTDFPISIRLTSLALWQSNDCPSASKATLMNMDKYFMWIHYERLHNHNKAKHNKTVCIFLGIYCMSSFRLVHDDVIKWKHFPRYWPFVRGIHRSPVNSPHKGQWRGALMFSLICARINGWVNNREAGDLRCYRAHYDVIVMWRRKGTPCARRQPSWLKMWSYEIHF